MLVPSKKAGGMASRPGLWLARRPNGRSGIRYYFQPSRFDQVHGWKMLRLCQRDEIPIADEAAAISACAEIAEIYLRWKQGKAGYGPHLIDEFGRVVKHRPPSI